MPKARNFAKKKGGGGVCLSILFYSSASISSEDRGRGVSLKQ